MRPQLRPFDLGPTLHLDFQIKMSITPIVTKRFNYNATCGGVCIFCSLLPKPVSLRLRKDNYLIILLQKALLYLNKSFVFVFMHGIEKRSCPVTCRNKPNSFCIGLSAFMTWVYKQTKKLLIKTQNVQPQMQSSQRKRQNVLLSFVLSLKILDFILRYSFAPNIRVFPKSACCSPHTDILPMILAGCWREAIMP
jgi:hypothetical protein